MTRVQPRSTQCRSSAASDVLNIQSLVGSIENPQIIWGNAIKPNGFVRFVTTEPPHSSLGTTQVSIDAEPDLVLKLAFDASFGHFETFVLRAVHFC